MHSRGFGWALEQLRAGDHVSRRGWNGAGQWVGLHQPIASGPMTAPYLFLRTITGDTVPWLPSQTDLLATDWAIAG